ncbi:DUF6612 family protein [Cohnella herbarum]|uniref:Lipoprotein n=1 Tax=Cohnella herbarum TaxID=2728023 RepID=A0A7Z2ZMU0_9BACL|nr:DUF6612 family protein [Cohnella herbarum]QJD85324.1 hypothetical protein HH215_20535 [Cohnella herbarum]
MNIANYRNHDLRKSLRALAFGFLLCLAACSRDDSSATGSRNELPSASASDIANEDSATAWIEKAIAGAQSMTKYGFELQMHQKLTGTEGGKGVSNVRIDMQGRVERNPLKLDQTIVSDIDSDKTTLRSVVVPDAYYMYLPEYEEWSKLSKDVAAENIATLSDYQVNPERALTNFRGLRGALTAEQDGGAVILRYEGTGQEAKIFLAGLLESTLGVTGEQSDIMDSLAVHKLKVIVTMDAGRHWPLSYRIESNMTIELEPGKKTGVDQTLAGTYSKHNVSAPITVPKEAEQALDPDELGKELGLE